MKGKPPFSDESKRRELRDRLNQIPGVKIPENAITGRPPIRLELLTKEAVLKQFLDVLDWCIEQSKSV
jgi:hypothetical protein